MDGCDVVMTGRVQDRLVNVPKDMPSIFLHGMNQMSTSHIDLLNKKYVCFRCICEAYLRDQIYSNNDIHVCSYCENEFPCFSLSRLSALASAMLEEHFDCTTHDGMGYHTADAIYEAGIFDEHICGDIQQILEDKHHSSRRFRQEDTFIKNPIYPGEEHDKWKDFGRSLKSVSRYFNPVGEHFLKTLFDDIDKQHIEGKGVIVNAGPSTNYSSVFRARIFQARSALNEALRNPDLQLGPPPADLAVDGRMNPRGVPIFYGALDAETAICEVRPPVGSEVVVARFDIIKPLRLFDFSVFVNTTPILSLFQADYKDVSNRFNFLRQLSALISIPVMPDDQHFDYLVMQALSESLRLNKSLSLDGFLFRSAQTDAGNLNMVLFHNASRVEQLSSSKPSRKQMLDKRDEALRLECNDIIIHYIKNARLDSQSHRWKYGKRLSNSTKIFNPHSGRYGHCFSYDKTRELSNYHFLRQFCRRF